MMLMPCKDCTERYPACSDYCPKYKEFRAKLDEINAAKRKEQDLVTGLFTIGSKMHGKDTWRKKMR